MQWLPTTLKNAKGNVTLMVGTLGIIAALLVLAIFSLGKGFSYKSIENIRFYSTVELIKSNVFAIIDNKNSWNNTITNNQGAGKMTCINTVTPCSISTSSVSYLGETPPSSGVFYGEVITLYDANNAAYFDSSNATSGFKMNGDVCSTYTSSYVDQGCAIRVRVAWQPFCSANCLVPSGTVVLRVNFFTPSKSPGAGRVPGIRFLNTQTDGLLPEMNTYR